MTRFQENAITWIANRIIKWVKDKRGIDKARAYRVIKVIKKVLAEIEKAIKEA